MKLVALVLLNGLELSPHLPSLKEVTKAAVNFYFNNAEIIVKKLDLGRNAYDPNRGQYNAERIISLLNSHPPLTQFDAVIALTEHDLYFDDVMYIFGIAAVKSRKIVISTYRLLEDRLRDAMVSFRVFKERLFKELMHELGHLHGLRHCPNRQCVMSFSATAEEVDQKDPVPCKACMEKLSDLGI